MSMSKKDAMSIFISVRKIITSLTKAAFDQIILWNVDVPVKKKQEEIKNIKKAFPKNYKKAADKKKAREDYEAAIENLANEIKKKKDFKEMYDMCFLYVDMGIQTIFNDMLIAMVDMSTEAVIKLSGTGKIVLEGADYENVIAQKQATNITPTLPIITALDWAVIATKTVAKASKWAKDGENLVREGMQLHKDKKL